MSPTTVPLEAWEGRPVEHWRTLWRIPALRVYLRVGSTNDLLRARAEAGASAGTVIVAEEQTAGRGQAGRPWFAPRGSSLLMSLLLRPAAESAGPLAPGAAPLRMGLAVARAVERVVDRPMGWKWPNDIVAEDGRKLAGILCEGALLEAGGYLVVGIGINVSQRPADWPAELRAGATSLAAVAGRAVSRAELAGAVIEEAFHRAGPDAARPLNAGTLAEFERRDMLRGRPVLVDGRPAGTVLGVAPDGSLRLREPDGGERRVRSGRVRPVPGDEPPANGP